MKRNKDDFKYRADRDQTFLIIYDQALHKYNQGKYRCEVKEELLQEYPIMPINIINEAIERVRKEYDFPSKKELGLY